MQRSPFRLLYLLLGFAFVGLGFLGIVLPGLPGTPFLLLAAGCFARSSKRCHDWLLGNRFCGPLIRDWQERRCVSGRVKAAALASILLFGGISLAFALESWYLRLPVAVLMLVGFVFVAKLPVCSRGDRPGADF